MALKKKDLPTIGNQRLVRMLDRTSGYCFHLQHIRGVKNKFDDALSRQPLVNNAWAEDFPRF